MRTTTNAPGQALLVICVSSGLWAFSFGLGAPLASLWLKNAGCSDTIIGLNQAVYYLGLALAALAVPAFMRVLGPSFSAWGMAVAGVTVALFPFGDTLTWWFGLRLLCGMAGAVSLIPMETYVNRDLAPEHRGRNIGLYWVALTVGGALGNWVGFAMVAATPRIAFLVGGALPLVATLLVYAYLPTIQVRRETKPQVVTIRLRENLLSFGSAWSQGFLEGGFIAFLSLYLIAMGLTQQHVGWLISAAMIGVIAFQVPVSWFGDYFGRQTVLLVCYGLVAVGLIVLPLAGPSALLPVSLLVVCACSAAFYPLGLALLGENLPAGQLDRANAWYLSVECVGSLMGPALMGVARDWAGEAAMFAVGEAAVLVVLATWLLGRRKDAPVAIAETPQSAPRKAA
ncbi:MAG TPA: MFS transporter [Gemmataceae bacterium]|nr:MFS transporter [Gemmataceae bacterium]